MKRTPSASSSSPTTPPECDDEEEQDDDICEDGVLGRLHDVQHTIILR